MAVVVTPATAGTGVGADLSTGAGAATGHRCPVTVVGAHRRVDLALPVDVPVGEYLGLILDLCEQPTTGAHPQVWSLAPLGARPLPLDAPLADCAPTEGMVLYLVDLAADEDHEAQVTDIDEVVAEATDELGRWRWNQRAAAATLVAAGVGWLVATVGLATFGPAASGPATSGPGRPVGVELLAVVVGLAVPGLVALARRRGWPLPEPLLAGLALTAPVALGCAGAMTLGSVSGAAVAASVGGLLAFAAAPSAGTLAVALWIAVAAGCAVPLVVLRPSGAGLLAVVALVGFAMLVAAAPAAGRLAMFGQGRAGSAPADDPVTVTAAVRRAYRVLAGWTVAAALLTATGLVGVARSPDWAAWLLVGALAVALVLRAVSHEFAVEAVATVAAAAAGLVTLTVTVAARWPVAVAVGVLVALTLVGCGAWLASRSPLADRRPRWLLGASALFVAVALVAALTIWGAVGVMLDLGRSIAS
ncbi:EsaB/YukD family protein [Solwaraspora sp. WMMA2056]|uniref:EsaB/YukD family protein n=1 Tax=Solwaraspora sp. WMMA2056 TaxID=3015161 RepID=UPI00259B6650|nr:EsaB/YukD family protein [Solwaraspora sp. WMMA2056]WJK41940.1 EsaB/YukD family protein [Solwaraspora sp. WMMA2056]